ncbi:hypothetical protein SLEP1_g22276 [Rubroshorea leprosula]|uniref:Uncharacterized protein n=1 Tax=Rubroshorea leprosula TaxID=152421 RepID=A0AAV5JHI0_9ROSI|nr:hypothetical protein SLEP1_g22276 [Rubroshorea leprosula]
MSEVVLLVRSIGSFRRRPTTRPILGESDKYEKPPPLALPRLMPRPTLPRSGG